MAAESDSTGGKYKHRYRTADEIKNDDTPFSRGFDTVIDSLTLPVPDDIQSRINNQKMIDPKVPVNLARPGDTLDTRVSALGGKTENTSEPPDNDASKKAQTPAAEKLTNPYIKDLDALNKGIDEIDGSGVVQKYKDHAASIDKDVKELDTLKKRILEDANKKQEESNKYEEDKQRVTQEIGETYEQIKNFKINPDRVFKNKSTGDKMMLVLGTFLSGLGDGPNQALEMINKMVDRDIDAQKTDLDSLKSSADYALKSFRLKWPENPEAAYRLYVGQLASTMTATMAAKSQGSAAKIQAEQLQVGLEKYKKEQKLKIAKSKVESWNKQREFDYKLKAAQAKAKGARGLKGEEGVRVTQALNGLSDLTRLKALLKTPDGDRMSRGFTPWTTNFDVLLKSAISSKVYINTGKAATEKEIEMLQAEYKRKWTSSKDLIKSLEIDANKLSRFINVIGVNRLEPSIYREYKHLLKQVKR